MSEFSNRAQYAIAGSLLLSAVLVHTPAIPQVVGYLVTAGVVVVSALAVLRHDGTIRVPKYALSILLLIWVIYLGHFAVNPDASMAQRIPVFIAISGAIVLLLPAAVSSDAFLTSAARLGGLLVLISLPAYVLPGITFGQWHAVVGMLTTVGIEVPIMDSVVRNPNTLAALCFVGAVGSVRELSLDRSMASGVWVALNGLGLVFVDSYAILLAVCAGLGFALAVSTDSTAALRGGVLAGVFGVVGVAFVLLASVPSLAQILENVLGGRVMLWRAAAGAWSERPFFGYGATNTASIIEPFLSGGHRQPAHSIVARMFITSGVVGAAAYFILYLRAIWDAAALATRPRAGSTLYALVAFVGLVIFDLFNGVSIFGLSLPSILLASTLGLLLQSTTGAPSRLSN